MADDRGAPLLQVGRGSGEDVAAGTWLCVQPHETKVFRERSRRKCTCRKCTGAEAGLLESAAPSNAHPHYAAALNG